MATKKKKISIKVGTSIIGVLERIDIEKYRIFSEFIDNSLQSYIDNKEILKDKLHVNSCVIQITWTNDEIVIKDKAFGMNEEAFSRALRLNAPKGKYKTGSLGKYGMGLKYAATNIGDIATIESVEYGSGKKIKGVLDFEKWKRENPEDTEIEIDENANKNDHYTTITIKKLKFKFGPKEFDEVCKRLGAMYNNFEQEKILSLSINGAKINYKDPELYRDDNGSELMETLNGSFNFEGKKYDYEGWVGILDEGSTYDAGLNLYKNKRVIEFSYRPKKLFGAVNGFKYQRVTGQIEFAGDNWNVRVNKDGLAWKSTGLEERFIEELDNNPKVKALFRKATEIRTRAKPLRKINLISSNCNIDGLNPSYHVKEKACFTVFPTQGFKIKSVKLEKQELEPINNLSNQFSFTVQEDFEDVTKLKIECIEDSESRVKTAPESIGSTKNAGTVILKREIKEISIEERIRRMFGNCEKQEVPGENIIEKPKLNKDGICIKFKNTAYSFEIEEETNGVQWLEIKEKPSPYQNSYTIKINSNVGCFKGLFFSSETKDTIYCLAICFGLASIFSALEGGANKNQTSYFLRKLNYFIDGVVK